MANNNLVKRAMQIELSRHRGTMDELMALDGGDRDLSGPNLVARPGGGQGGAARRRSTRRRTGGARGQSTTTALAAARR